MMSKDELKNKILNLELPAELETVIVDMIESVTEVNGALLNTIADILDTQAEFYQKMADTYQDVSGIQELTDKELEALDAEKYADQLEAYAQTQEEMLKDLEQSGDNTSMSEETRATPPSESPVLPQEQAFPQSDLPSTPAISPTNTSPVTETPPQPTFMPTPTLQDSAEVAPESPSSESNLESTPSSDQTQSQF